MNKKRMNLKKNLLLGASVAALTVMAASPWVGTANAYHRAAAPTVIGAGAITPYSAIIEWRYKVENGRLYRRLYNYTEQCWVGDWILCP